MIRLCLVILVVGMLLPAFASAQNNARRVALGPNADLGGLRLLPDDNPWNKDISKERVDPASARILARVGLDKTLHADFGTEWEGAPIGIPYVVRPRRKSR